MSDQRKPRGLARFREREVTRITKAVRVAGGGKVTLDPDTGLYTIVVASEGTPPDSNTTTPGMRSMLRTRSGLPRYCGWNWDREDGKRRVRFRKNGFSVYLTGIPWSPEFWRNTHLRSRA